MSEIGLSVGDYVEKVSGYRFTGTVVSAFETLAGKRRVVVDNGDGMLHIFNEGQMRPATRSQSERVSRLEEALIGILEVAPHLPSVHQWLDQKDAEQLFDVGLRHKGGKKPADYLKAWLGMARPFAYATQDDSWGELEKLLCIILRNYVRVAAAADRARSALNQGADDGR